MHTIDTSSRALTGTVVEVLPVTGLAYVTDEHDVVWTLTRSTRCTPPLSLADLQPGQRLALTLVTVGRQRLVSRYTLAAD